MEVAYLLGGTFLTTVSMENLILALRHTLGKKGMKDEEIVELADYVLSFFGFENEVIDNRLTAQDRDVFYMLEEEGILKTTQEQVNLKRGKLWRIHYWVLKGDLINELASQGQPAEEHIDEMEDLYGEVDDEVWSKRGGQE
ncbi:MAG: hypothetical protein PHW93_05080 [Candidatus Methanomethylophilaceae archaeon]|nr:hypothetical protein [Candidatus Methanomethylophilaceae archaeon]